MLWRGMEGGTFSEEMHTVNVIQGDGNEPSVATLILPGVTSQALSFSFQPVGEAEVESNELMWRLANSRGDFMSGTGTTFLIPYRLQQFLSSVSLDCMWNCICWILLDMEQHHLIDRTNLHEFVRSKLDCVELQPECESMTAALDGILDDRIAAFGDKKRANARSGSRFGSNPWRIEAVPCEPLSEHP